MLWDMSYTQGTSSWRCVHVITNVVFLPTWFYNVYISIQFTCWAVLVNIMNVLIYYACIMGGCMSCLRIVVSNTYCVVSCFGFHRLVYPMLPVSLDYPFVIAPSVFSNVYLSLPYPYFRDLFVNTLSSHLNPSMFWIGLRGAIVC